MKILNIHGYKGSAENSACLVLKEMGFDVISPQIDYDAESPEKVLDDLRKIFTENKPDYIIGTSLGGFFALLLSIESEIPTVLVSPCLLPFITLSDLGYNNDLGEFEFAELFRELSKVDFQNVSAIIGEQDEIISYHKLTKTLVKNCTVIPDGKHSGATLPLKEFFGELIK